MRMHLVLIILILTFIQGHTDLNHENNKCLIISETIQAMPIKFALKIARLKVHMTFIQGHKCLKLDYFLTFNRIIISAITFKLGMTVDIWMPYMLVSMTLTLMQGHRGLAKANKNLLEQAFKKKP